MDLFRFLGLLINGAVHIAQQTRNGNGGENNCVHGRLNRSDHGRLSKQQADCLSEHEKHGANEENSRSQADECVKYFFIFSFLLTFKAAAGYHPLPGTPVT